MKVKFKNGYETELTDEIAKRYEKAGRVEIVKPARKAKSEKTEDSDAKVSHQKTNVDQ